MSKFQEPTKRDPLLISALQWIEANVAAQPMDKRIDISLKRGAAELDLLAQGFAGLRFTDLNYSEDLDRDPGSERVHLRVIGSGADLVRHGFLNAGQLDAVANCKTRKVLRDNDGSCIEVDRSGPAFLNRFRDRDKWKPAVVMRPAREAAVQSI